MNSRILRTAVLSALSLFLSSGIAQAQYNKSFDWAAVPQDVAACNNGEYCTVSPSTGFRRYDYSGNLLWERTYSNLPLYIDRQSYRLVHTDDDGVIFFTIDTVDYNPIAGKIDNLGNLVWAKQYFSNSSAYAPLGGDLRVDATHMENTADEGYMMVTSGKTDLIDPRDALFPYALRNVLNVLRIDGSGNLVWNKKYTEGIRDDYFVNDMVHTISYGGHDDLGNNNYYIGGLRHQKLISGGTGSDFYFQLSIDEAGNIVNNYQALTICSFPDFIDAEYVASENSVITSFMFGDCPQTDPNVTSQIGFLKLDPSLNMTMQRYYAFPSCNEHHPWRIQTSQLDGAYLISGQVLDRLTFPSITTSNFFLLKLRSDGTPIFSKRYMVAESGSENGFITNYNPSVHDENYVMVGQSKPFRTANAYSSRIISTDNSGGVCGQWDFPVIYDDVRIPFSVINYSVYDVSGQADYSIPEIQPYITGYHNCDYYHESGYRKAGPDAIAQTIASCKVYPTILSESENQVSVDVKMNAASNLQLSVYSIDGRKITEQSYSDVTTATLKISLGNLLPGNYLVNIRSDNKEISTVTRFSKM